MNGPRRFLQNASAYFFVFSMCLFALIYGVLAGHYQLFPYPQLRDAKSAAEALLQIAGRDAGNPDAGDLSHLSQFTEPVARTWGDSQAIDDETLILVSGGAGHLTNLNPDGGCLAWLMNREGQVLHYWKYKTDLWADLGRVSSVPGSSNVYPLDVHVLDDGGLLVSFQGHDTWPFAIGLARLDKDSNTVWKKECYAHHWFTFTADGKLLVPTLKVIDAPRSIAATRGRINSKSGKILEDYISVMSLDGDVLEEFSMMDVVHDSGLVGLYQSADEWTDVDTTDPLHLNSIQRVGEEIASAHDWLNPDDVLVSFRSINTVAIIDWPTRRIKWYAAGQTMRQHSPRFKDANTILVFDNLGGAETMGGTRLAEISINERSAATVFPSEKYDSAVEIFSRTAGHLDVNRDASAVLMAVTHQSTVFEIDLDEGTVLWEYNVVDPVTREPLPVYTARYVDRVDFEMNHHPKIEQANR